MFEYFPNNYTWSLAVMSALNRGGQMSEIDEACRPLKEIAGIKALAGDPTQQRAWFESWMKVAERVQRLGEADEAAGHPLSAGRKYLRAGLYYLLAERMPSHKDPRRLDAYKRGIELYKRGLICRKEPVEFVEVPYTDHRGTHKLPAYFMKAPGCEKAPCVVHFDGLDVTKEIIYAAVGDEFRRRGVSLLIVDHPGVGAALRLLHLPSGPDTEKPAGAAIDYLETRSDVDAKRIGIMALSLGGYYAPRAAAMDGRFACCISWGPEWDYHWKWQQRLARIERGEILSLSVPWQHLLWVFGVQTKEEAFKKLEGFKLDGVIQKMRCPYLLVHGEGDQQAPFEHAQNMINACGSANKHMKIFKREEGGYHHCQVDNVTIGMAYMSDWVAEVLKAGQ